VADPDLAPAGRYAEAWLVRAGVRDVLADRLVPTADVRVALATVVTGHADAAIVYATDAATSDRVRIAYRVPEADVPAIRVVAAVLDGPRAASARRFVAFLREGAGRAALERHGFDVRAVR
jgi:molybdate transport system substrate-binding protein